MTDAQFQYLMLACGSFVVLGLTLAVSTVQYWTWKRRTAEQPSGKRH